HEVLNQPAPLADYDAFSADRALREAARIFGADWAREKLVRTGRSVGSAHVQQLARQANRHLPELRTHDRFGHRLHQVEFHPACHELMGLIYGQETHALGWTAARPGGQVARAILSYLWNQGENGVCCPMGMSFASLAVLAAEPGILARWRAGILSST